MDTFNQRLWSLIKGSKIINGGRKIDIDGVIDGIKYKMVIRDGKIVQFFPF